MLLRLFFLAGVIFGVSLSAQSLDSGSFAGRIEKDVYYSPTKAYHIRIPVLPQLGGQIKDTDNVVTFQDQFGVHVSIATFPQDANQRRELTTRGMSDYLAYFLNTFVIADFVSTYPGSQVESMVPTASIEGGALLAYVLLPGGSMFADRASVRADGTMPAAKRGNLAFVKDGFIYVISMELAERMTEGTSYKFTKADEDRILKQRIEAIIDRMTFTPVDPKAK